MFGFLKEIGKFLLCFMSGGLIYNFFVHLNYSFYFARLPERYKNSYMRSHTGNVIASLLSLLFGFLILPLLHYHFGINLMTLVLFLGFAFGAVMIAMRFDKSEKK